MRSLTLYLLVKVLMTWAEKLGNLSEEVPVELRNDLGEIILDIEDIAKKLDQLES